MFSFLLFLLWTLLASASQVREKSLVTIGAAMSGMDICDIDKWWKLQEGAYKSQFKEVLPTVFDDLQVDELDQTAIVRFKQLLRLACLALETEKLYPILLKFGPGGTFKWPVQVAKAIFIHATDFGDASNQAGFSSLVPLHEKEIGILRRPLGYIIPINVMKRYLGVLEPHEARLQWMGEIPIFELFLGTVLDLSHQLVPLALDAALDDWMSSAVESFDPISMQAIISHFMRHPNDFVSPLGSYALQAAFQSIYGIPLTMIQNPDPDKRRDKLNQIRAMLRSQRLMAGKKDLNIISPQDYFLQIVPLSHGILDSATVARVNQANADAYEAWLSHKVKIFLSPQQTLEDPLKPLYGIVYALNQSYPLVTLSRSEPCLEHSFFKFIISFLAIPNLMKAKVEHVSHQLYQW